MITLLLAIIYLAFISLGLPDALLGSAWPIIYQEFDVSVSSMGFISMIISAGTIVSSLMSDRLTLKLGTGKITALSVAMTAIALMGFSLSTSYWMLCLWAIPYGLGAGSVDASINNYVALHYESRHMSWLHCMWGIGAATGPSIMGFVLTHGQHWSYGYRYVGILQIALTAILFISLPLWKTRPAQTSAGETVRTEPLSIREILHIPGAKEVLVAFFCYCALEATTGQWATSYLVLHKGVPSEMAASFASMFFIGITIGRALNGFLTIKFNDKQLIHLGEFVIAFGIVAMLLPLGKTVSLIGLIVIGLGCAPIYPCIIHSTPELFGEENSQALIGVQMASAYTGTCIMPPIFGLIAQHISITLYPIYLFIILILMFIMYKNMCKKCER